MRRYNGKHWDAPFRLSLFISCVRSFSSKFFFASYMNHPNTGCVLNFIYIFQVPIFVLFFWIKKKFVSYKLLARSTKENVIFFSSLYIYMCISSNWISFDWQLAKQKKETKHFRLFVLSVVIHAQDMGFDSLYYT